MNEDASNLNEDWNEDWNESWDEGMTSKEGEGGEEETPEFDPEVGDVEEVGEGGEGGEVEEVKDVVEEKQEVVKGVAVSFEEAQAILSTSESETMELGPRPAAKAAVAATVKPTTVKQKAEAKAKACAAQPKGKAKAKAGAGLNPSKLYRNQEFYVASRPAGMASSAAIEKYKTLSGKEKKANSEKCAEHNSHVRT